MGHIFSSYGSVFLGHKNSKLVGHKIANKFTNFLTHNNTTFICIFMSHKNAYKITNFMKAIIYTILWPRKKWSPRRVMFLENTQLIP